LEVLKAAQLMRLACLAVLAVLAARAEEPIRGFPQVRLAGQRKLEEQFRTLPRADLIREYNQRMSAEPHHAGSAGSRKVAEYALKLFRDWGLEARIETFEAMLPYPAERIVEMTAPVKFRARSRNRPSPKIRIRPTRTVAVLQRLLVGRCNRPWSVNYGIPADYEFSRRPESTWRKIAIALMGELARNEGQVAAEHGALGRLIYPIRATTATSGRRLSKGPTGRRTGAAAASRTCRLRRRPADPGWAPSRAPGACRATKPGP
jgi:N-acetylated-alpha-linked acidic dipeptidase